MTEDKEKRIIKVKISTDCGDGDHITDEALAEALAKNPTPGVFLNFDHSRAIGHVTKIETGEDGITMATTEMTEEGMDFLEELGLRPNQNVIRAPVGMIPEPIVMRMEGRILEKEGPVIKKVELMSVSIVDRVEPESPASKGTTDRGYDYNGYLPQCPWCKEELTDSPELDVCHDGHEQTLECAECGKNVIIKADVNIVYSTRKKP